jgi:hypothetical protein
MCELDFFLKKTVILHHEKILNTQWFKEDCFDNKSPTVVININIVFLYCISLLVMEGMTNLNCVIQSVPFRFIQRNVIFISLTLYGVIKTKPDGK